MEMLEPDTEQDALVEDVLSSLKWLRAEHKTFECPVPALRQAVIDEMLPNLKALVELLETPDAQS